ncbi:hypothetical protein I2443_10660 [Corynebacterium phoceense]|nr:hypothetical protein [Corynebacterium phoceense]
MLFQFLQTASEFYQLVAQLFNLVSVGALARCRGDVLGRTPQFKKPIAQAVCPGSRHDDCV